MNIKELVSIMPGVVSITGNQEVDVNSVADDSREVKEGALFVAISGSTNDGHNFIPDALRRGAKVIIGEKMMDLGDKTYSRVKNTKCFGVSSAWFTDTPEIN